MEEEGRMNEEGRRAGKKKEKLEVIVYIIASGGRRLHNSFCFRVPFSEYSEHGIRFERQWQFRAKTQAGPTLEYLHFRRDT